VCGQAGSAGYAVAVAWTTPLSDATGTKIRVVTEESDLLRGLWIKQGLFFTSSGPTQMQIDGTLGYNTRDGGPYQTRLIYPISKADMGFAVRGDSGIKTPHDIKPGMKIIYISFAPHGRTYMEAILAWAQVDPDDVSWVPAGSIAANTRFITDGKGDVAIGFPATPYWYETEASPHGLAWIEMDAQADPEGAARYVEVMPDTMFATMDQGVPTAHGVKAVANLAGYCTRAETDPELVYHVVKWLDENNDLYKDGHPWCPSMTIANLMTLAEVSWTPLHDGSVKYLEEKGLWTDKHEARRQANIDLITRYISAYQVAIGLADDKGIDVDSTNEQWTALWEDYKQKLNLPRLQPFTGID